MNVDFRAVLLDETHAFGELLRSADPATAVPTCPDWTLKQLFRHVGRGNRWAAQIVLDRRVEPLDPRDVPDGRPPDDPDAAIDWLDDGARLLLRAVDVVGSAAKVWTFLGARPAGWWIRRRAHEVAVHRADAAIALGADFDLPAEVAADGISEWIERCAIESRRRRPPLDRGQTLHLHATDGVLGGMGEWTVTCDEEGLDWFHDHGKGDVAVRGPARDLLLAITRRRTAEELGLELFGDAALWQRWLAGTPF